MILSGNRIKECVDNGEITIEPFHVEHVNPNSYNVKLHPELKFYDMTDVSGPAGPYLDAKMPNSTFDLTIPDEGVVLLPNRLYLGRTVEYTETPNHVPMLEGRSSLARLGVCVHITAGFGDRGFKGHWTLEITCVHPVKVYPNMRVAQLCYYTVDKDGPTYKGKYNNKLGSQPGASQFYKDLKNEQDPKP